MFIVFRQSSSLILEIILGFAHLLLLFNRLKYVFIMKISLNVTE